jgi:hypothetical protein
MSVIIEKLFVKIVVLEKNEFELSSSHEITKEYIINIDKILYFDSFTGKLYIEGKEFKLTIDSRNSLKNYLVSMQY